MIWNKRGADKILAVYWFAILVLISAGIFSMVFTFQIPYDVRSLEADILNDQLADCLAPGGLFNSSLLSNLEKVESGSELEKANLDQVILALNYAKDNIVDGDKCNCGGSCEEYAENIFESSEKNQILDPLLLSSIMIQESSCKLDECSDSSCGLMQINLEIHCGKWELPSDTNECKAQLLTGSKKNIEVSAQIFKEAYDLNKDGLQFSGACKYNKDKIYYGWEAALRAYNGKGCNEKYPKQDFYVERVMSKFDVLREEVGMNPFKGIYSSEISPQCNLNFKDEEGKKLQYFIEIEIKDFVSKRILETIREGNFNLKADCEAQKDKEYGKLSKCSEKEFYSVDENNQPYSIKILSIVRKTEENVR